MEPNHFKHEGLYPIVGWTPKGDRQINLPKWHDLLSRHVAVERCSSQSDVCSVDAHSIDHFSIHDVEAAASIHQYLGEMLCSNDRVDHKRVSPRLWDVL